MPTANELNQMRQEEALQIWEGIQSGRIDPAFLPDSFQKAVISTLGSLVKSGYNNAGQLDTAISKWVQPAASGAYGQDMRNEALDFLGMQAVRQGNLGALSGFQPQSTEDIYRQADLLAQMANMSGQQGYQDAYQAFMNSAGNWGTPGQLAQAQVWAALSQQNPSWRGTAPDIMNQDAYGYSENVRNALMGIGEMDLAGRGKYVTPWGLQNETPLMRLQRLQSEGTAMGQTAMSKQMYDLLKATNQPYQNVDISTNPNPVAALNPLQAPWPRQGQPAVPGK
jgi:hypothetical protein